MPRLKRRVAWDVTTFDNYWYSYPLDRFIIRDDPRLLYDRHVFSTHSRRFRTKRAALRFLRSDTRCPRGGRQGWILMKVFWTGKRVLTHEYAYMMKV